MDTARETLKSLTLTPNEASTHGLKLNHDGQRRSAYDLLSYADHDFSALTRVWPELASVSKRSSEALKVEASYAVYMNRQASDIAEIQREEARQIPDELDFMTLAGLSTELKQKLTRARPANIAQAARLDGMTPAAISLLLVAIRRQHETRIAS